MFLESCNKTEDACIGIPDDPQLRRVSAVDGLPHHYTHLRETAQPAQVTIILFHYNNKNLMDSLCLAFFESAALMVFADFPSNWDFPAMRAYFHFHGCHRWEPGFDPGRGKHF
jgi:hypothetical protein